MLRVRVTDGEGHRRRLRAPGAARLPQHPPRPPVSTLRQRDALQRAVAGSWDEISTHTRAANNTGSLGRQHYTRHGGSGRQDLTTEPSARSSRRGARGAGAVAGARGRPS